MAEIMFFPSEPDWTPAETLEGVAGQVIDGYRVNTNFALVFLVIPDLPRPA